jgi:hypothetical protein
LTTGGRALHHRYQDQGAELRDRPPRELADRRQVWFQQWRQARSADQDALHAAIGEIMSRSQAIASRARAIGEVMKQRSGLPEALDIVMRHRKPVDIFELHDWLAQDFAPLNDALSEIWTRGDQDCVRLANEVVDKCGDVIGAGGALEPARSLRDRVRKYVIGERWTPEMLADYEKNLGAGAVPQAVRRVCPAEVGPRVSRAVHVDGERDRHRDPRGRSRPAWSESPVRPSRRWLLSESGGGR